MAKCGPHPRAAIPPLPTNNFVNIHLQSPPSTADRHPAIHQRHSLQTDPSTSTLKALAMSAYSPVIDPALQDGPPPKATGIKRKARNAAPAQPTRMTRRQAAAAAAAAPMDPPSASSSSHYVDEPARGEEENLISYEWQRESTVSSIVVAAYEGLAGTLPPLTDMSKHSCSFLPSEGCYPLPMPLIV